MDQVANQLVADYHQAHVHTDNYIVPSM